jgi:hypothetical protein
VGDLLHTFSRREYRALSRTSHASAASSGTPRSRLLLSAVAAVMTVSGRASYVRQHECHTSTTPAVLLLIRSPITMDQSQQSLIYGDRSLHLVRARTRGAQTKRH